MIRTEWDALSADERRAFGDPARNCYVRGCTEPPGTPWGPHFCADHDDERINRISRNLKAIAADLARPKAPQ